MIGTSISQMCGFIKPWLKDELLTLQADQEVFIPGADGLKRHADGVTVSNTSRGPLLQIKVDEDVLAVDKPVLLAEVGMIDGFWVNPDDSILFTTHGAELNKLPTMAR